jgi:hypothetical protein
VLKEAAEAARRAVPPIDDVRAGAEYRRQVAGNLLLRLAGGKRRTGLTVADARPQSSTRSLFRDRQFIFVAATFIAYANYSVFFRFYDYLTTLPIGREWFG